MPSSGKNSLSGLLSVTRERRAAGCSAASPANTGARRRPSRVRSAKRTRALSRGSTQLTSRTGVFGIFGSGRSGGVSTRSAGSRASRSVMVRSSRPLPTLPTQAMPSSPRSPSTSAPSSARGP